MLQVNTMPGKRLDIEEMARTPIPAEIPSADGWQAHPLVENNEPVVSFEELGIPYASFYAGEHDFSPYKYGQLEGALHHVYVRPGLGKVPLRIQDILPDNMSYLGLDGLRFKPLQASLFEFFDRQLQALRPDWSTERRLAYTQQYVSKPSADSESPAPHKTGAHLDGVIMTLDSGYTRRDIARRRIPNDLVLRHGKWLEYGVPFDHGGEEAGLRFHETHDDHSPQAAAARASYRIQYWVTRLAGGQPYIHEFWETCRGSQKARIVEGSAEPAVYGAIDLSPAQRAAERQAQISARRHKIVTGFPLGAMIQPEF